MVGAASRASISARRAGAGCAPPSARRAAAFTPAKLKPVELPILILGAERDRLVSAAAIRARGGRCCRTPSCEMYRRRRARDPARRRSGPPDARWRGSTPSRRACGVSRRFDVAIVGAGMAGASLAAELAGAARVLLLEAEDQPGYHAHRPLRRLLVGNLWRAADPAADQRLAARRCAPAFCSPRGALHIAERRARRRSRRWRASSPAPRSRSSRSTGPRSRRGCPGCGRAGTRASPSRAAPTSTSPRLHAFYLAGARGPAPSWSPTRASPARERDGGRWRIETAAGTSRRDILVNAAGAWADEVARAGRRGGRSASAPYRRTIAQLRVDPPRAAGPAAGGRRARAVSTSSPRRAGGSGSARTTRRRRDPCDCAPEEIDVAIAIDRLEQVVDWRVERGRARMGGPAQLRARPAAGLRLQRAGRGFFWCAGQGGFGIQTAPAAAALGAAPAARPARRARSIRRLIRRRASRTERRRVAGERVGAVVLGMAAMALHPMPFDPVRRGGLDQLLPELGILDRLAVGGAPAVLAPAVDPFGDAVADIDAVGVEL